jgi:phosphoenolpyruvate---glycerone phosphotransferase subunit DhaK
VLVYGNYAGDNMNFDMAAELADAEGIETRTVRVWDDVAAAPKAEIDKRRGIAGDVFVIKIAGAAAATIADLDEVYRIASKARDNIRSLGVSIRAGSLPETGELTFELADDEIEIGMGAHGEPGVAREKLKPADALADQMLAAILDDGLVRSGDEICLMLNDLGATTMMELLIVNRRLRKSLRQQGIEVFDTKIGSWLTTQEMAGFSITIMKLDDELRTYYTMPARSWAWTSW